MLDFPVMSAFHVTPLVLVIQTKFSCSSSCALAVCAPALNASAIKAIAVVFAIPMAVLFVVVFVPMACRR